MSQYAITYWRISLANDSSDAIVVLAISVLVRMLCMVVNPYILSLNALFCCKYYSCNALTRNTMI